MAEQKKGTKIKSAKPLIKRRIATIMAALVGAQVSLDPPKPKEQVDSVPVPRKAGFKYSNPTRSSHEEPKYRRVMAARSRRINQGGSKRK